MSELFSSFPENKINRKSPFAEGEIFDAQEELNNLKQFHGEEGLEKVKKFKEKLRCQRLGLARMENKVIEYLEQNNNLQEEELLSLISADIREYALNNEQIEALKNSIKEFVYKNNNINEVVNTCKDEKGEILSNKLYEKIFGKAPEGKVEAIVNSYSIYFRPSTDNDYCYVASAAYKKRRSLTEKDMKYAKSGGGMKLDSYPNKKLNGLISIENAFFFNNPEASNNIMIHERKHVINGVLGKYFNMPDNDEVFRKYQESIREGKMKNENGENEFIILNRENLDIEKRIKDEICAYFKDGSSPKYISRLLLQDNTIYDYAYSYNLNGSDDFDLEYLDLVEDGITAFAEFINKGYKVDEVINLLLPEPLNKWPKILQRMTNFRMNSAKWQKKKKAYISQKILQRDLLLKEVG